MPWAYYGGLDAPLDQKLEGLARYFEDIVAPVNDRWDTNAMGTSTTAAHDLHGGD